MLTLDGQAIFRGFLVFHGFHSSEASCEILLDRGRLFNPAFATEISLIDPLPHQRVAVYEHMLAQTRLRFLLADDAGAGKAIMAGLYIREMLARRLLRRVLIVPPAGLVGNWEREMRSLFSLPFRLIAGSESREEVNAILKSIANELELR